MNIEERDRNYLQRIIDHCERIESARKRFGDTLDDYLDDADYRDVICMNIFQIGELSNRLSEMTKEKIIDVPWHQIIGIRNILAHAYIKIDDEIIWDTVINDISKLKSQLEIIIE